MQPLRSAGFQMNPLKCAQRPERRAGDFGKAEIDLSYFVSRALTGVGDGNFSDNRVTRSYWTAGNGKSAISECGVTQAVTKWIERRPFEVAIGAALHRVILKGRQLSYILVEGDGQGSGGVVAAREGFSHGGAALFAGIPGFEDSVGVSRGPMDAEGAAIGEHYDQWLARGGHGFQQLLLGFGKVEAGAGAALEAFLVYLHL